MISYRLVILMGNREMFLGHKLQIPSTKSQKISKFEYPIIKILF
jgi:hypothetical protein